MKKLNLEDSKIFNFKPKLSFLNEDQKMITKQQPIYDFSKIAYK